MRRKRNPGDLRSLAGGYVRRSDPGGKRYEARVTTLWPHVAGSEIAQRTRGFALREGELMVFVSSSAWANELSLLSEQLRVRLNEEIGEELVRSMRFTVSRKVQQEAAWEAGTREADEFYLTDDVELKALPEPERQQIEFFAAGIGDEELRAAATRAMTRSLEQNRALRAKGPKGVR